MNGFLVAQMVMLVVQAACLGYGITLSRRSRRAAAQGEYIDAILVSGRASLFFYAAVAGAPLNLLLGFLSRQ